MAYIVTNDGVKLWYEDKGQGRPLVMIHGWSCSSQFFRRNVDELAKHCRVIAMDLRGHGKSEKPAWGYRISRMAKDLKDLIDGLKLKDVTVLGWSMGAAIAWSYIDLFGNEALSKLICVDQSPRQYYSGDWKLGQGGCYDAESLAVLCSRLEFDFENTIRGTLSVCLTHKPSPEETDFFLGEFRQCPGWVQAAIMTDHTNLDWREQLPQIKDPTLVLVGRKSMIFPWQGSAYVGEHIPKAETVFFENSGHMLFYEESEKFNEVVRKFVAGSVATHA
jgi:pimeloyl-ACP methyl ester carboxylesterase